MTRQYRGHFRQTIRRGSHDLFLAQILAVRVSSHLIDGKGKFRLDLDGLSAYDLGHYYSLDRAIDNFCFSNRKRNKAVAFARSRLPAGS